MTEVILVPLTPDDREQFINDNQKAFNYDALEEFGFRDEHFELYAHGFWQILYGIIQTGSMFHHIWLRSFSVK